MIRSSGRIAPGRPSNGGAAPARAPGRGEFCDAVEGVGADQRTRSPHATRVTVSYEFAGSGRAEPGLRLLDAQAGDRPTDHELLDLLGALEDVEGVPTPFVDCRSLQ